MVLLVLLDLLHLARGQLSLKQLNLLILQLLRREELLMLVAPVRVGRKGKRRQVLVLRLRVHVQLIRVPRELRKRVGV